jgi:hypothetical protein
LEVDELIPIGEFFTIKPKYGFMGFYTYKERE